MKCYTNINEKHREPKIFTERKLAMKKLIGFQKGVNLGGWLSQNTFTQEHLDTFITEKDIAVIKEWGCDHLRLPVDFENIEEEDGSVKESGFNYIETCIGWCRKYGLNMVLDLHKTCGYIFDDAAYSAGFFDNKELQDRFIQTWDRLSSRFSKDSDIVMFEMLNEVTDFAVADKWNEIALRCIKTIRKNAPTAKILYGGVGYSAITAVKLLAMPTDENIVYNIHCYEPLIFTHQTAQWCEGMPIDFHIAYPDDIGTYQREMKRIKSACFGVFADESKKVTKLNSDFFAELFEEAVRVAEERNVSLYCGEYGVIDQAPTADTLRWFKDINTAFEKYGIGRAAWSYKQMDFGLSDEHYKDIITELTKYL